MVDKSSFRIEMVSRKMIFVVSASVSLRSVKLLGNFWLKIWAARCINRCVGMMLLLLSLFKWFFCVHFQVEIFTTILHVLALISVYFAFEIILNSSGLWSVTQVNGAL